MKKLLSVLISASIFASLLAVPAFADYEEAEYDVQRFSADYETDGTVTNTIDGSKAKWFTDKTDIFGGEFNNKDYLLSDFFLTLDFNFYSGDDGSVPGEIAFTGSNVGPTLTYDVDGTVKKHKGELVSQHDGNNYDSLGPISPDTWYTLEVEGRFKVGADFRVYEYVDGEKKLVTETKNLYLRNYAPGNTGTNPGIVNATNIYIDNVEFYSTHPDTINVTTATDEYELRAGKSVPLEFALARNDGKAVTNTYSVTLELLDEDGAQIEDDSVYLTSDNMLATTVEAQDQTVTVKATATVGEEELVDTRTTIDIKAVNIENEPFDKVTVIGPDSVKAGTSVEYTFTATKGDVDVTDSLNDDDFKWLLYSTDDLYQNNNNAISITKKDGDPKTAVLTVDEKVIAQKLNVRLSSDAELVFGSRTVNIEFAESQTEQVLAYNAAEETIATATRVESIDGSLAYQTNANTIISLGGAREDYVLTEFDIRFATNESGVYWERGTNGGEKWNTSIYLRDVTNGTGTLKCQTGGSSWSPLGTGVTATTDDWFHFEVLYKGVNNADKNEGVKDASCIVTKYNEDGTLDPTTSQTFLGITMRNADAFGSLDFTAGLIIDNIKVSVAAANELELVAPRTEMFAGESVQFTATASRNGLPIKSDDGITWQVLDEEGLPIIGDDALVKISENGLLTVDPMAQAQTVTVKVSSASGEKTVDVEIKTSVIFEVKNIGVNEDKTKIVSLYVDKNFNYTDAITFIIAIYGENNNLKGVSIRKMYGDSLIIGANKIPFDFTLPNDFNPDTDKVKVMGWTAF